MSKNINMKMSIVKHWMNTHVTDEAYYPNGLPSYTKLVEDCVNFGPIFCEQSWIHDDIHWIWDLSIESIDRIKGGY